MDKMYWSLARGSADLPETRPLAASVLACVVNFLTLRSLLLRRRRGGSLRPIWALIPRHSLRDLPLVGTRGGDDSGSYNRGERVCPCKQLAHRHQVIVVVGNDDWGGAAWKE
jgi:hypothetical protein